MIQKLKYLPKDKYDDINFVAVAIKKYNKNQNHAAFMFKDRTKEFKLFHLEENKKLTCEDIPLEHNFVWLDMPLNKANLIFLSQYIDSVSKNNQEDSIYYGISIQGIDFDTNGKLLKDNEFDGLTCATFILKVLESRGYNIFKYETWKPRYSDIAWQNLILKWVALGASKLQVNYQNKLIGSNRYRPEEVVSGASCKEIPLSFKEAISLGKELDEFLLHKIK
ncbi:MAG: hypothetical protein U9R16_03185 [Campylobacterota bacterium]|nr:hypothetical protein [Campylobacterota bacterium]